MAPTSKSFVTVLFLALALCQLTAAEPSLKDDSLATKIVRAIKDITTRSTILREETEIINVLNAPRRGVGIPLGFTKIINKVVEVTLAISSATNAQASPLSDDDAKLVVETLTTFVEEHQQLLNVVIEKHMIPTLSLFFEPIRSTLVQHEVVVDSFAFALIDLIPTQKEAAKTQFASLAVTITAAIDTYNQPSLHGNSPVEKIQKGFEDITQKSDDLRSEALKITDFSALLLGPRIAPGFFSIAQSLNYLIVEISAASAGTSPLSDDDAKLVVKSLTKFVQVHQALLELVIGKHGIITMEPFFQPIRMSLVSLEAQVDSFAFYLIKLIPAEKAAADAQVESLGGTLKLAIDTYSSPFAAYVE